MTYAQKNGQQLLNRLQLVARVQLAYEQMRDALERAHGGSLVARTSAALATRRLALLSRGLALMALGPQTVPA